MGIFEKMDILFAHGEVSSPPSAWLMHRFLASDRDYALVAREVAQNIRDDELVFEFWKTIVPKGERPYLEYVAPKKQDAPPKLVERLMDVMNYGRQEAEDAAEIIELAGETEEVGKRLGLSREEIHE